MKIIIGSDHGGFKLKEAIKDYLLARGHNVRDVGCDSTIPVDYPVYARTVAEKVATGEFERGILVCGTGIGMSIVANKIPGIRAALCNDLFSARYSRLHNDANILTMGGRIVGEGYAKEIVSIFLKTDFEKGRHERRVKGIMEVEKRWMKERDRSL